MRNQTNHQIIGTMRVYYKKHKKQQYEVIAVCDEDVLGKSIGSQKINEFFYKGELIDIQTAVQVLKTAQNFNIAGKHIINACIEHRIISEYAVITINSIPIAMKFLL